MSTEFEDAVRAFRDVQHRYAEFGAWDTEPSAVFGELVAAQHDGHAMEVPSTIRGWELYSGMAGSGEAARELAEAARVALRAARKDADGVREFLGWW